jgi:hypothetical protein
MSQELPNIVFDLPYGGSTIRQIWDWIEREAVKMPPLLDPSTAAQLATAVQEFNQMTKGHQMTEAKMAVWSLQLAHVEKYKQSMGRKMSNGEELVLNGLLGLPVEAHDSVQWRFTDGSVKTVGDPKKLAEVRKKYLGH